MAGADDPFEASASALGYMYQFVKALEVCIEQSMNGIEWSVAVEATDDIETQIGSSTELTQLKRRADGVRLTDSAPDLWKTLRIWAEATTKARIDLTETSLFLLTTAELPEGSAGFHLQHRSSGHRDEDRALTRLREAREASESKDLQKAFKAFDELGEDGQRQLLSHVEVLGDAPGIEEIRAKMRGRAVLAAGREFAESFLTRLEGWFYNRVIGQMRTPGGDPVTGAEFDEYFTDLRNQFGPNNLPIDPDIADFVPETAEFADKVFARQLGLINVGAARVHLAVRDYIRAFTQRSRWSDENLLRTGEIGAYERRLVEEWQSRFAEMEEELGPEAAEEEKILQAKLIYSWVDREARFQIRTGCDEAFVAKGSYHMLADELRVGWHPDFTARLMALLEPAESNR